MKDIIGSISTITLGEGKSKAGNTYHFLDILFINGYKNRVFLNSDAMFGIEDAISKSNQFNPNSGSIPVNFD